MLSHSLDVPCMRRAATNVRQWETRPLESGGFFWQLLTLGDSTIAKEELPRLLRDVIQARAS